MYSTHPGSSGIIEGVSWYDAKYLINMYMVHVLLYCVKFGRGDYHSFCSGWLHRDWGHRMFVQCWWQNTWIIWVNKSQWFVASNIVTTRNRALVAWEMRYILQMVVCFPYNYSSHYVYLRCLAKKASLSGNAWVYLCLRRQIPTA